MTASSKESGNRSPEGKRSLVKRRADFLGRLIVCFAALAVSAIGVLLFLNIRHGAPLAAPFTRAGGASHVETAVDATRFWLTPSPNVVEVSASADESTMLSAATCAMAHDAPLLFAPSHNETQQKLVTDTLKAWNLDAAVTPLKRNEMITINKSDHKGCLGNGRKADANGLSTFPDVRPVLRLPEITPNDQLSATVIFAAAWEPNFAPDVTIGMALGAHMATPHHPVSLIVVPRYLEADPGLETTLENQHQLVSGGVVLGQAVTVPDDTRALLRQLLTSTDRQGLLKQADDTLGSVAPLVTALLAVFGIAVAAKTGKDAVSELAGSMDKSPGSGREWLILDRIMDRGEESGMARHKENSSDTKESPGITWSAILAADVEVIVWLRSGKRAVGTIEKWYPEQTEQNRDQPAVADKILRLKDAYLGTRDELMEPMKFVLIPVEDIELISQSDPSRRAKSNPARPDSTAAQAELLTPA